MTISWTNLVSGLHEVHENALRRLLNWGTGRRAGSNSDERARAAVRKSALPATLPAYDTSSFTTREVGLRRREHLLEEARRELREAGGAVEKMKMIDTIQRLGIGYYMDDEIDSILLQLSLSAINGEDDGEEDLFSAALRFRLLRQDGHHVSADVFWKFMDKDGRLQESVAKDTLGLLSLYEASYLATHGEKILIIAMDLARTQLKTSISDKGVESCPVVTQQVKQALEVPRQHRMARLETKRFIEEYTTQSEHNPVLVELAILDYNEVQTRHQMELEEIKRWWKQLGLMDNLDFCRDRFLECFFWIVGILPNPKYSECRIEIAKSIAILLVIDDIFDTYGKMDDLILFTKAIQRWDLEAMEGLPHYMKICYMALYNSTNEICYKILKQTGWSAYPCLKQTWIDMIEGYMSEAKWFGGGEEPPTVEEYIENGVSTVGAYMALVHLFFLMGEGITAQNAQTMLSKPYPKLFSSAGRLFRLWDDLGTGKEEHERGDLASTVYLLTREKGISKEEGRNRVLEEIKELWKDLNGELISKNGMPLFIIKVALDLARASQVIYNHEAQSYLYGVENYVHTLFFSPLLL